MLSVTPQAIEKKSCAECGGRRGATTSCSSCARSYHKKCLPPSAQSRCSRCGLGHGRVGGVLTGVPSVVTGAKVTSGGVPTAPR